MMRRMAALALCLALLLAAAPAMAAGESVSANTPLPGDSAQRTNLRLAAQAIDGTRVSAGGRFSFNDTVGPRTRARGYRTAPNGRGAPVTGGGVAQAATTLYLALRRLGTDVRFDPIRTYGSRFTGDYVTDPEDAVITDYDAGIDFAFTNRGDALSIDMWLGEDALWCVVTTGGDEFGFSSPYAFADDDDDLAVVLPDFDDDEEEDGAYALVAEASIDCGGDGDVLHNVKLAADCISDTVLERGDTFSFNDVVGPRTRKYGYRQATNGRGVRVIGGGVAQVATVLWLTIKDLDDFAIVEKSTYGKKYNQHYVDSSADAILTDYASGRDFAFRYNGRKSLTLYTYVQDGWLYCEIYEN